MSAKVLVDFLEKQHVPYVTIEQAPAYTAEETAASAHIPGQEEFERLVKPQVLSFTT